MTELMNTLKSNVYEKGPNTKWESFEDVLIRYAKTKYGIELTKEQAAKFNSIGEFDSSSLKIEQIIKANKEVI